MESEQLQEDSSTLLDWILKLCLGDHQIIPLILFADDFVLFLSRLISDVGKGKIQVKSKTPNSEETTSRPDRALPPIIQPSGVLTRGRALHPSPRQSSLTELCSKSPKYLHSLIYFLSHYSLQSLCPEALLHTQKRCKIMVSRPNIECPQKQAKLNFFLLHATVLDPFTYYAIPQGIRMKEN